MGEIIIRKVKGMNWKAKISLVLIFTLVFSTFMYQGLWKPKEAVAAVSTVTAWAHPSTGTTGSYTITNATFSCGTGSTRLLVAVVTAEVGTAAAANVTATKGTGVNFTTAVSTASARGQVWIGYLTESQITGNTNSISITNSSGQAWTGSDVYLVCYDSVSQSQPLVTSGTWSAASDTAATSSNLSIPVVNGGVIVYGNYNNNTGPNSVTQTSVSPSTPAWTEPFDLAGTGYATMVGEKLVNAATTPVTTTFNWASQRYSNAAISINPGATDSTPPTTGTVSVSPDASNGGTNYTSASPTITASLTDAESTVNSCEYTTDNGTNWYAGVVTGSSSPWTCTGSPTGLSGSLTGINIRGTSGGGQNTSGGTAIQRTVDSTGPTDGSLTVTPGNQQNGLSWTAASDGASGLRGTNTYDVRFLSGASAPTCSTGTSIYTGTNTSTTHSSLTNGQQYSYRVCAYDAVNNASTGATGSGTPVACIAGQPTSLAVGTETTSSVPLTWTGGANTTYFRVYRNSVQISTDGAVTTGSFTDSSVTPGATYSYTVSGYNTSNNCEGSQSSAASAYVLPVTPGAPTVTNVGDGTSLNVAIGTDTNDTTYVSYAIRINGGAYTNQYVQANGSIGASAVWQTKSTWGTKQVTGLTTSTTYTFDVQARNSNPTPDTSSWSATTAKAPTATLPSAITTCAGCHGYPPVDSTTRDASTGRFPGSHDKHVGWGTGRYGNYGTAGYQWCADCHQYPNWSTLRHRTGIVNFTGLGQWTEGAASGAYSKGNFTASDTFAPGTCSATYCHSRGTGWTSNIGDSRPLDWVTSPRWGSSMGGACNYCHGWEPNAAWGSNLGDGAPWYTSGYPKANTHPKHINSGKSCNYCHASTVGWNSLAGTPFISSVSRHVKRSYDVTSPTWASFTYWYSSSGSGSSMLGGTCANNACHGTVRWGGALGCTECHAAPQGSRAAVVGEFGLAWGHKKSGRGAVASADCIVCHLEGKYSSGVGSAVQTTAYHKDGNVDLRDPDGAGETPITDNSGGAFTFTKYWVSWGAGSRSSTLGNTVPEVITNKFCLKCHDANGASNPTARAGTWTTWFSPWSTTNLGANYTVANGAAAIGGLIDVNKQFWFSNSSRHPVGVPNNRAYPYSGRLAAPYDNIGTARNSNIMTSAATPRTKANSVILLCDDCHTTGTSLTDRMITAHGNAVTLRGIAFSTGSAAAAPTLCLTCHIQGTGSGPYNNTATTAPGGTHGSGSAFGSAVTRAAAALNYCHYCHFSTNVASGPGRPRNAQDVHGFNEIYNTSAGWTYGAANGARPFAFLRNTVSFTATSIRPYSAPGITTGQATCGGSASIGTLFSCNDAHTNYAPGGTY